MKHVKSFINFIFESYSTSDYDKVLDIYNNFGIKGMTPNEVKYLKSGGESQNPTFMLNKENRKLISDLSSYVPNLNKLSIEDLSDQEFLLSLVLNYSHSDPKKSKPIVIDLSSWDLPVTEFSASSGYPYDLSKLASGLQVINFNPFSVLQDDLPRDNGKSGNGGILLIRGLEKFNRRTLSQIVQLAKSREIKNGIAPLIDYILPDKWILVFTCIENMKDSNVYFNMFNLFDYLYVPLEKVSWEPKPLASFFKFQHPEDPGEDPKKDDDDDLDQGEEWKKLL